MWLNLFNEKRHVGKKIRYGTNNSIAFIMPRERVVNIDEPMDLEIAKILMQKNPRDYVGDYKI